MPSNCEEGNTEHGRVENETQSHRRLRVKHRTPRFFHEVSLYKSPKTLQFCIGRCNIKTSYVLDKHLIYGLHWLAKENLFMLDLWPISALSFGLSVIDSAATASAKYLGPPSSGRTLLTSFFQLPFLSRRNLLEEFGILQKVSVERCHVSSASQNACFELLASSIKSALLDAVLLFG